MVIHTTKGLPSMDMLRQDPAPPLLRDASFPTDTTTTLVAEDSAPPPEPNKVLPEVMSYALAELTEEEEVEQKREIKDILAQVHAETASAIAAEEALPKEGVAVSQCKVKRTNDDDTFERNVKTCITTSPVVEETMLSAGVLAGITSIWDYQSQIRKAEASTKFRYFVRDDIEIMKELGMKSYNTDTLADAYVNIHREVKKIYTKTMFLIEGTVDNIVKAATGNMETVDATLESLGAAKDNFRKIAARIVAKEMELDAAKEDLGAKIMVTMVAKTELDAAKEELDAAKEDLGAKIMVAMVAKTEFDAAKEELDAATDTKEELDAATDTKEELDAATVAETELEVYVTRCEWCECVCQLAKELMKKVEIELSKNDPM
jgi:hypothetical protein